ncbi:MAG: hypothetical protein LBU23_03740, partial [Planctomycetota bacterium]|nr:hypothetical protein [Planctomycetota bacterium]
HAIVKHRRLQRELAPQRGRRSPAARQTQAANIAEKNFPARAIMIPASIKNKLKNYLTFSLNSLSYNTDMNNYRQINGAYSSTLHGALK